MDLHASKPTKSRHNPPPRRDPCAFLAPCRALTSHAACARSGQFRRQLPYRIPDRQSRPSPHPNVRHHLPRRQHPRLVSQRPPRRRTPPNRHRRICTRPHHLPRHHRRRNQHQARRLRRPPSQLVARRQATRLPLQLLRQRHRLGARLAKQPLRLDPRRQRHQASQPSPRWRKLARLVPRRQIHRLPLCRECHPPSRRPRRHEALVRRNRRRRRRNPTRLRSRR